MRKYANLMSEGAQFRAAARIQLRRWALALVAVIVVLIPLAVVRWQEVRRVRQQHEALEAGYDPIRRLTAMNNELRTAAATLVRDERLPLELSRNRPSGTLLAIVSDAAAASNGELYVEHLKLAQAPPSGAATTPGQDRLIIDVATTLTFDVANFVEALKVAPIVDVKVAADELVEENGVDRKNYSLECLLTAPHGGKAAHAN
jgi:hypothetical protein